MKVRIKVDKQWLDLEQKSMSKLKKEYAAWEASTLQKVKEVADLRSLREVFYELGDRWEFDQATGSWLSEGEPLDTIGFVLRMPGLTENTERYVFYAVMAYSKGLTDKFDHLGDKERVIIERDLASGTMKCWSTTGHGAMDVVPTRLEGYTRLERVIEDSFLIAQPGDHALRLERSESHQPTLIDRLWKISNGDRTFTVKEIDILTQSDLEDTLDFKFYRYAKAVIELERIWKELAGGLKDYAREAVLDEIPDHIQKQNEEFLRQVEGLLHIAWFKPVTRLRTPLRQFYDKLTETTPAFYQKEVLPYLGELLYSLNDIIEKAKYIKWKSVIDRKEFRSSDVFKGLDFTTLEKEAFAAALEDILQEHTLSYIGFPERATMKKKVFRVFFDIIVLPIRLFSTFVNKVKGHLMRLLPGKKEESEEQGEVEKSEFTTP